MIQIAALPSRLEKHPTDLRRSPRDLGDGALVVLVAQILKLDSSPEPPE